MSGTLLACAGLALGCIAPFALQNVANKLMFFPDREVPDYRHSNEHDYMGINFLFFDRGNDTPIVLYSHGNAGNIFNREMIKHYLNNVSLILYDYRGFGRSVNTKTTTKTILEDGETMIEYIKNNFPNRKIVLVGESMGSAVTWHLVSKYQVDAVAIISGYASLSKVVNELSFKHAGNILSYVMHMPDNSKLCKGVTCPIAIIHGKQDETISYEHALKMKEINKEINLYLVNGDHCLCPSVSFGFINDFMKRI